MEYPFIGLTVVALVVAGTLHSCGNLTRFEQESYDCNGTNAPFRELVFNDVFLDGQGKVVGPIAPPKAVITDISKSRFSASWGDVRLSVNRVTGKITLQRNGMVSTYKCEPKNFRM